MRKVAVYFLASLLLMALGLPFVQRASSQPSSIRVVSYGWYIGSNGYFDVVGEVQNVGESTVSSVRLTGTVYAADGEAKAYSYPYLAYVNYLLPQQKAPFFIEFTGDLNWLSLGVDRVDFTVLEANATSSYQYSDLTVESSSGAVDGEGVYWVRGTVKNTGSQTATTIRVIGTFYNDQGTVVAVGYTDPLTPASLTPSSTASFKVGAFDQNQTVVSSDQRISSYSLMVQTEEPILTVTAPPPSSSNSSSTTPSDASGSSTTPSDTIAPDTQLVAVIVIVVLGLAGVILVLNRRKSLTKSLPKPKATKNRKSKARKKQR